MHNTISDYIYVDTNAIIDKRLYVGDVFISITAHKDDLEQSARIEVLDSRENPILNLFLSYKDLSKLNEMIEHTLVFISNTTPSPTAETPQNSGGSQGVGVGVGE